MLALDVLFWGGKGSSDTCEPYERFDFTTFRSADESSVPAGPDKRRINLNPSYAGLHTPPCVQFYGNFPDFVPGGRSVAIGTYIDGDDTATGCVSLLVLGVGIINSAARFQQERGQGKSG